MYKEVLLDVRDAENRDKNKERERYIADRRKRLEAIEDKYIDEEIDKDDYQRMTEWVNKEIAILETKREMVKTLNRSDIEPKLDYAINLISKLEGFLRDAPTEVKIQRLGSMFPEKIEFDGEKYRTNSYNKVLDLIYQQTNELCGRHQKEQGENLHSLLVSTQSRDRTGTPCGIGV